ncbi:PQQ-dependent sugar dehydrogenase [Ferrovibrio sp.]|uniref:PQQ-dependent sugar dehydrogenase n=1 Tax=Ferrovibrio sp. TaxID=1917215 RepID=UPI0025C2E15A|nr:PQQ-dependent sugar dehydrogenase [Ferrovibrio sp.]MBX3454600.1 PQQ-dependent sugar dehydrogenase [Ferrovibrio sp.]
MHPLLALLLLLLPGFALAQTIPSETGPIRAVTVTRGLEVPWSMAFLPDGRMLVTERPGRLRMVARDGGLSAPLAGVPKVFASGQGGLLDVVLDPNFASNRLVYLSYAEPGDGGAGTAVARGKLSDSGLQDVQVIFRQQPKVSGGLHFGARLAFDRNGLLFIGLGERYRRDEAQILGSHLGKLIRIKPDGSLPPDNPFVGRTGALPEIYSYGHRNIQGMTLHPETGALWLHEHGAQGGDEINLPQAGLNYGWPVITHGVDYSGARIGEGTAKAGMEQPLLHWTPSIAPAGMAFYFGDKFPAWRGNLFVGSLKFRTLHRVVFENGKPKYEEAMLKPLGENIRDVRAGPDGYLYIATDNPEGRIIRLEPAR